MVYSGSMKDCIGYSDASCKKGGLVIVKTFYVTYHEFSDCNHVARRAKINVAASHKLCSMSLTFRAFFLPQ